MPQLLDPHFRRTVVFMLEHNESGSFGLVVNRETDLSISDLCASLEIEWRGTHQAPVRWGGPVQPEHGWLLLGEDHHDHLEALPVAEGIRFARSPDVLREVASSPGPRVEVFLGCANWGPGQLVQELIDGAWIVAPVSPEFVFDAPRDTLWEEVVRDLGIEPATLVPTAGVN
jgi:putative transcriptional regulator